MMSLLPVPSGMGKNFKPLPVRHFASDLRIMASRNSPSKAVEFMAASLSNKDKKRKRNEDEDEDVVSPMDSDVFHILVILRERGKKFKRV